MKGDLRSARSFEEILGIYGYSLTDNIDRRQQIIMYNEAKGVLSKKIKDLVRSGQYIEARSTKTLLTEVEEQFRNLQTSSLEHIRTAQAKKYNSSSYALINDLRSFQRREEGFVEGMCDELENDTTKRQDIERELLEHQIGRIEKPKMKKSRRLLDLETSEKWLSLQCQYEEAANVRRMIGKIKPVEQNKFDKTWEESISNMRDKLDEDHRKGQQKTMEVRLAFEID